MPTIGFIGLGNMGAPMAANLAKAGNAVIGFDVVAAARQACAQSGLEIAPNGKAAVESADIVITMLPAGRDGRPVRARVLASAKTGALLVDFPAIVVTRAR